MRYHQISSVAVSVELTEFLDNIFKMPIFKSKQAQLSKVKPSTALNSAEFRPDKRNKLSSA